MPIRQFKPVTKSSRFRSVSDFAEITRSTPEKSLLEPIKKSGGRDNHGHISMRRIGGGHKRKYRIIDFKRNRPGQPATVREIESRVGVREDETAYVGDDLPDLPVIRRVGFSAAPQDAVHEVRNLVDLVTKAPGGRGCAREVAERILKAQQRWDGVVESFLT